jgi:Co/Zn/Cd efflux system component
MNMSSNLTERMTSRGPETKSEGQIRGNQWILGVTMVTFALFVIAEIIGALAANSLSLLGGAAAMSIDVITVLFFLLRPYSYNAYPIGGRANISLHSHNIHRMNRAE